MKRITRRFLLLIAALLWALFFIPVGLLSILIWIVIGEGIIDHYIEFYHTHIDISDV